MSVSYNKDVRVDVDIGRGPYKTEARPKFFNGERYGPFAGAAVLAPIKAGKEGVNFDVHLFYGYAKFRDCLTSFIDANLPALLAFIREHGLTIHIPKSKVSEAKIENIKLPSGVKCRYGAPGRWTATTPNTWRLDAVLHIDYIEIDGSAVYNGAESKLGARLEEVFVWVELEIDTKFANKPKLSDLRISFDDYKAWGNFFDKLKDSPIYGWLVKLLINHAGTYRIASAFNTELKDKILKLINDAIPPIKLSNASLVEVMLDNFANQDSSTDLQPSREVTGLANASPKYKSWMSTPEIQAKKLKDLKIPGTHDSATSALSTELSQVSYGDIAFLWSLSSSNAPANGLWPFHDPKKMSEDNPLYVGKAMHSFIIGDIARWVGITHGLSMLEQLRLGIRHFDLRIYFDTRDSKLWVYHGNKGPSFTSILDQIKHFLDENPTASELIFVAVRGFNLKAHPEQITAVASLIEQTIEPKHRYQPGQPGQPFEFQTLADTTVASITGGVSKVMFLNTSKTEYLYPTTVTNSAGYEGLEYTGDAYDFESLVKREGDGIVNHEKPLWSVGWVLGAKTEAIVAFAIKYLTGDVRMMQPILQDIAESANSRLYQLFERYKGSFNLVTVDFPEQGSSKHGTFMDFMMKLKE